MPINKVGTKGIADGSIASAEIADGIVTSAKLQNGAVTNVKLTNTAFTLSGTSISLGGSATFNNKFVDWQSVIVADGSTGTTGVSGRGYFINTTSAAHTFTLPSSATRGDNISIKDYAGTFATNNLTIARNGHNIQGVANNSLISTNRASVVLVYVDVTRGWEFVEESNVANLGQALFTSATGGTITTSGNFKIHTFTGDGCFVVSTLGNSPTNPLGGPSNVDHLVVAGGAGGGNGGGGGGGGGGAGGFRTTFPSPGCNAGSFPITATTFPITVGAGGTGAGPTTGGSGSSSIFSTITSAGGGGGGSYNAPAIGIAGGSGGGGGVYFTPSTFTPYPGGAGNTPPTSPSQGNTGGTSAGQAIPGQSGGGGGGGAGAVGSNAPGIDIAGNGGAGSANSITGSSVTYSGGGGGAACTAPPAFPTNPPGTAGTGGPGGGGRGGVRFGPPATVNVSGTANTGGGGGGSSGGGGCVAGAGGKGIVVIRYKFQ